MESVENPMIDFWRMNSGWVIVKNGEVISDKTYIFKWYARVVSWFL